MAERIFNICKSHDIKLVVEWVPRELNQYADYLSKVVDHDDWQTSLPLFNYLEKRWGPHTIDRFASSSNTRLRRFNSKYLCPNTEQVNAFSTSWEMENNYLVPPVSYVPKVLTHLKSSQGKGTLVVPHWPSAAFFPLLFEDSNVYEPFVKALEIIPFETGLLVQGENKECFIGSDLFKSDILAIRIEF